MKFGAKLRAYALPEWRAAYIDYGALKTLIKQLQREIECAEAQAGRVREKWRKRNEKREKERHRGDDEYRSITDSRDDGSGIPSLLTVADTPPLGTEDDARIAEEAREAESVRRVREAATLTFDARMESEVEKVVSHFNEELMFLVDRLLAVEAELKTIEAKEGRRATCKDEDSRDGDSRDGDNGDGDNGDGDCGDRDEGGVSEEEGGPLAETESEKTGRRVSFETNDEDGAAAEKEAGFAKLNTICVYKILKKRDKKLKTKLMHGAFARLSRSSGEKDEGRGALTFHQLQMSVHKDMLARRGISPWAAWPFSSSTFSSSLSRLPPILATTNRPSSHFSWTSTPNARSIRQRSLESRRSSNSSFSSRLPRCHALSRVHARLACASRQMPTFLCSGKGPRFLSKRRVLSLLSRLQVLGVHACSHPLAAGASCRSSPHVSVHLSATHSRHLQAGFSGRVGFAQPAENP
uniref:Uncharacterized protein NCLIV_069005 n=1 Tax=Neospora caninum (strain Liverpool) TaxID=572307 RepID=F0JAX3_NEOCL|nr:unnamed protein product [Neospora caninum Liverpool]CEL71239.1 TPA: unnamed protein product [Neospora caninum Liverpool]